MIKDRNAQFTILAGVLLLIVLLLLSHLNWLEALENLSLDLRFTLRGTKPFNAPVTIIGIDEASIDTLGRWPWLRSNHATILKLFSSVRSCHYAQLCPHRRPSFATALHQCYLAYTR